MYQTVQFGQSTIVFLSLTMILNCELVVLRYLKVYRSIFWCLDVFLWVACS